MISTPDRQAAVMLIHEAVAAGARKRVACRALGITLRTLERWTQAGVVGSGRRPRAHRPAPPPIASRRPSGPRPCVWSTNRALQACRLPRSCHGWPTRGVISPRNPRSIACCAPPTSWRTGAARRRPVPVPSRVTVRGAPIRCGAGTSHTVRPANEARLHLGVELLEHVGNTCSELWQSREQGLSLLRGGVSRSGGDLLTLTG